MVFWLTQVHSFVPPRCLLPPLPHLVVLCFLTDSFLSAVSVSPGNPVSFCCFFVCFLCFLGVSVGFILWRKNLGHSWILRSGPNWFFLLFFNLDMKVLVFSDLFSCFHCKSVQFASLYFGKLPTLQKGNEYKILFNKFIT